MHCSPLVAQRKLFGLLFRVLRSMWSQYIREGTHHEAMLQQERQPVTGVVIATLAGLLRDETGNSLLGNCGRRTRPTGQ